MKSLFSAPILLGLCLSGVLADLPYHNFEGRDANIDISLPHQSTHHYPMGTETGSHHHTRTHHHHSPTGSDPPEQTPRYNKYEVRHEPLSHHHPHPTSYPTGGDPSHHHHSHSETPPYPTNTEAYLQDEHAYTMKTVTRTGGPSAGFPPYGTGRPYPYSRKV